jgi:hypothetical protein
LILLADWLSERVKNRDGAGKNGKDEGWRITKRRRSLSMIKKGWTGCWSNQFSEFENPISLSGHQRENSFTKNIQNRDILTTDSLLPSQ